MCGIQVLIIKMWFQNTFKWRKNSNS